MAKYKKCNKNETYNKKHVLFRRLFLKTTKNPMKIYAVAHFVHKIW